MNTLLTCYIFTGVAWGLCSLIPQFMIYGFGPRAVVCFALNFLLWPLTMPVGIYTETRSAMELKKMTPKI